MKKKVFIRSSQNNVIILQLKIHFQVKDESRGLVIINF